MASTSPLRAEYDRLNAEIDELHIQLAQRPSRQTAETINSKLAQLGDLVANLYGAGEITFDEAAKMIRQDAWVRVGQYA